MLKTPNSLLRNSAITLESQKSSSKRFKATEVAEQFSF